MANAFRAAESGRPGAAHVNLPKDVMSAPCAHAPLSLPAFAGPGPADSKAIKEAARLINAADNPVVLLGMLSSRPANAEALQPFLTKSNLAVVGTFQAAGAVGALLFDNFGGRVGQLANQPADRLLDSADLIITIGHDPVEYWPPEWNVNAKRKIIHIDVLPADLDNFYQPYIELTGDIAQTLRALTPQISRSMKSALSANTLAAIAAERNHLAVASAKRGGIPIHPLRLVHESMPRRLPPYVERNHVKGHTYLSFRRDKGPRVRLPNDPTSLEFMAAYQTALLGQSEPIRPRPAPSQRLSLPT
jgi:acetolactate synthase-1/2/3 large subunit